MRVLHIITRMIRGGAQENTLLSMQWLQAQPGVRARLIAGPSLGPEGDLKDEIATAGLDFQEIPALRRAINPWHDWLAYRELRREIAAFAPEIIHTHSSKAGILGRLAAWPPRPGQRVVHTIHGLPFHPYQNFFWRQAYIAAEKYAAKRCHKLVTVCEAMRRQALAAGVGHAAQYTTVYSGMRLELFQQAKALRGKMRAQYKLAPTDFVVAKVARLFSLKGHEYLLYAAAQLKERLPQLRLLLIGGGQRLAELQALARRLGLAGRIVWTGLLAPGAVPGALSAADALAHCSLREGLARVLPQAFMLGLPVVSFDVDGAKEVARSGETGWLTPPRDVPALARALAEIIADYPAAQAKAARGQKLCGELFAAETMGARLFALYEELLAAPESG